MLPKSRLRKYNGQKLTVVSLPLREERYMDDDAPKAGCMYGCFGGSSKKSRAGTVCIASSGENKMQKKIDSFEPYACREAKHYA